MQPVWARQARTIIASRMRGANGFIGHLETGLLLQSLAWRTRHWPNDRVRNRREYSRHRALLLPQKSPAVDVEQRSIDEPGGVAYQKQHRLGDFLRRAVAAQRCLAGVLLHP